VSTDGGALGGDWQFVSPDRAGALVDARLQCHHAVQLATAIGISYLAPQADDSHTNLEWLTALGALMSNTAYGTQSLRLGVRLSDLTLLAFSGEGVPLDTLSLNGRTIDEAVRWIRIQLTSRGIDPDRFTMKSHFTIPEHAVQGNRPFDTGDAASFAELSAWFDDAATCLNDLADTTPNASPVRCWPHHFDIATLLELSPETASSPQRTIGVGMEPGDTYYPEPYWYVNLRPAPGSEVVLQPLSSGGVWHTHEWIGAVLKGSRMQRADQRAQVRTFVHSAIAILRA
jgi:hypothetical protein